MPNTNKIIQNEFKIESNELGSSKLPKKGFDKIAVVGLGYIGLPTAAVFASRKIEVIGIDVSEHAVTTINRGEIHITEPDLDLAVRSVVSEGYLFASLTPKSADAFMIAVPTPFKSSLEGVKIPDLSFIEAASRTIAAVLKAGDLVVLESTSPVGATERMAEWLAEERPDLTFPQTHGADSDVRIAHCPERVLPGHVLRELVENDRVIGGMTPACSQRAVELYKLVVQGECIVTDTRTAEMAKLTENSFRDVNIAFANELSVICDKLDINVWELTSLANRHPRVNILQPGPGVGGHCIAVDPWFIVATNPKEANIIKTARETNDAKPGWVVSKVEKSAKIQQLLKDDKVKVACFGLAFKPDIDDLRESPALQIVDSLIDNADLDVLTVEPNIHELPKRFIGRTTLVGEDVAMQEADILVMLVDHKQFREIDVELLNTKVVIDTRGIWTS
ncbi:UDP-N-acetyl-D-mannosamine dehydrogenase [Pseudovibrio sp. WM33]|uniref:UDP-N-acetyl-D-mannosamine dehydrogenase n=1 Tax=Pseudovibrio sp. WM33 TaxID=1735585 RepID=UPI0007B230F1|nr:UDP-N-acetyl-D-mannosamine dehydrogenase [Pseudovibrio sp. WM33]KZL17220.1 UDP-N-acetyl-D-glucosamine 6-dehydrogenase [Pseudovibrio sp. WM33]